MIKYHNILCNISWIKLCIIFYVIKFAAVKISIFKWNPIISLALTLAIPLETWSFTICIYAECVFLVFRKTILFIIIENENSLAHQLNSYLATWVFSRICSNTKMTFDIYCKIECNQIAISIFCGQVNVWRLHK